MTQPHPPPLRRLHDDGRLLVIDKPPGLLVHRTALDAHAHDNVLQRLRDEGEPWLWPVHRLDKGTSGALVLARDAEAARALGTAFEAGAVAKRYLALVRGWPDTDGCIDHPLARDPERPSAGQETRAARTHWRRLATFEWPFSVDGRHPTSRYALVEPPGPGPSAGPRGRRPSRGRRCDDALRQGQLRRHSREPVRARTLRPRARRLHRRACGACRLVRAGGPPASARDRPPCTRSACHCKHVSATRVWWDAVDSTHGEGTRTSNRAVAAWLGLARLWLHAGHPDLPPSGGGSPPPAPPPPGSRAPLRGRPMWSAPGAVPAGAVPASAEVVHQGHEVGVQRVDEHEVPGVADVGRPVDAATLEPEDVACLMGRGVDDRLAKLARQLARHRLATRGR